MSMRGGPPMQNQKKRSRSVGLLLRRMGGYFRGFRNIVIIGAVLAITSSAIDAVSPLLLSSGIDTIVGAIVGTNILSPIILIVSLYFILRFASWVTGSFYTWVIAKAQAGFVQNVQKDVHAHLIAADLSYHKSEQSGNVTSRVTSDTDALSIGIQVLMDISSQIVLLVVTFLVLWFTSPIVAMTALITVPVVLVMTVLYGTVGQRTMLATQRAYGQVSGQIAENLSGIQIAKAFNREKETSNQLYELNQEAYKHNFRLTMFFTFLFPTVQATAVIITAAVLFIGAGLAFGTVVSLTIGELFLGVVLVQRFMFPLLIISLNGAQVQASLGAMDRISDVLEKSPSIKEAENAVALKEKSDGISFKNVTFSYVDGTPVLRNVSFTILPGETAAIVGKTGAGKTTIASLVNRFYDPQEGRILIGAQDIREITFDSLHDTVALVAQEPYLFDGTVLQNMKYGAPEISDKEVKNICENTRACEFLETLPNGYDSLVLEGGKNLSSGQRQMITIVRMLLANPRILILDEATSRLDAYSESLVQYAQEKLFSGRTTLVIAHRLSTIANADKILVFEEGQLAEIGTHDELLQNDGIYRSLYETYYAHQGIEKLDENLLTDLEIQVEQT